MATDTDITTGIRCLAIDDEPLALLQLKAMIERTPYLTLVEACSDAIQAQQVLAQQSVDAIFVDINMPELNGLDFVASLTNPPLVVFTTAYSEYALDSYKVNAVDYLLKPFGLLEFQHSAKKVKRQYQLLQAEQNIQPTDDNVLYLKADHKVARINIPEIKYIESMREYLRIFLEGGEKLMTLMPISKIITMIDNHGFVRIHRSFIVNMSKVAEVAKNNVRLNDGTTLPIGDSFKDNVKEYIQPKIV